MKPLQKPNTAAVSWIGFITYCSYSCSVPALFYRELLEFSEDNWEFNHLINKEDNVEMDSCYQTSNRKLSKWFEI